MSYNPKEYWEDRADSWVNIPDDLEGWDTFLKDYLDPELKTIEIGSGTGRFSVMFDDYEGWDISQKLTDFASKKHPDKTFKCVDIRNTEVVAPQIFAFSCLQHIPKEELAKVVLKGKVIAIEPNIPSMVEHCYLHDYTQLGLYEVERNDIRSVWTNVEFDHRPKVSIIMPTYNNAPYLVEAVESCMNQTYSNIELVIVDDGSTDSTPKLLDYLCDKYPKISRYTKENTGLADSENYAIERAKGKIIARADSDDIQLPEKVEILVKTLLDNKVDFAYTGYYHADIYGNAVKEIHPQEFSLENIRNNNCMSSCSFAYWKDKIKVKYRPEFRVNEDKAFLWDVWKTKPKYAMIDIPIFKYRLLPTGMSYARKKEVEEIDKIINKEIDGYQT